MADCVSLADQIKEQGEVVRKLKAAKADKTSVTVFSFLFPSEVTHGPRS